MGVGRDSTQAIQAGLTETDDLDVLKGAVCHEIFDLNKDLDIQKNGFKLQMSKSKFQMNVK
jgi:hypothetical protein